MTVGALNPVNQIGLYEGWNDRHNSDNDNTAWHRVLMIVHDTQYWQYCMVHSTDNTAWHRVQSSRANAGNSSCYQPVACEDLVYSWNTEETNITHPSNVRANSKRKKKHLQNFQNWMCICARVIMPWCAVEEDRQWNQTKRRPQQVYSNQDLFSARRNIFSTPKMLTHTHR